MLEIENETDTQNSSFGVKGKPYLFIGPRADIVVSGGQAKAWLVKLVQRIRWTHNHTIHSKQENQCIHSTSKKKKKKVSVTMIKIKKSDLISPQVSITEGLFVHGDFVIVSLWLVATWAKWFSLFKWTVFCWKWEPPKCSGMSQMGNKRMKRKRDFIEKKKKE